ncbi:hypothetical protein ACWGQL_26300 [Streptomyces lydicus]
MDSDWHWLNWVQSVWNAVAQVFGGAAQALTSRDTGAALSVRLVCLGMLLALFWALRKAMLASNAYRPGPMDVQRLIDATPEGTSTPRIEDLTARLRKHLSETDLYPPAALPAEPPAENFLDLVGDVNLEPAKLGTSLLHLFSRLRPKVAYRVSGVLQCTPLDQKCGCGVTVTITSFATRGSCAHTVWESTWEKAVHEAGCWVMATILPVTRASRKPPWQAWRGRALPSELFAAYQKGRELSRERKFDEALHHFYKAERWDPTNLFLRTQVAEVQEKLGLSLDALETYHGALTLSRLNTDEENTRLWVAPWALRRFTYLWHWRKRPGILQARYRYAIVLGTWERTADQWCHDPDDATHRRRADVREEIRKALTPAFADRYWPAVVEIIHNRNRSGHEEDDAKKWIRRQLLERRKKKIVSLIFQLACLQEMRRLTQDCTIARLYPRLRTDKKALTRSAIRINRDIWAPLRLAWACDNLSARDLKTSTWLPPCGAVLLTPAIESGCNWFRGYRAYVKWPANTMPWPPRDLKNRVRQARMLFLRESHRHWQDHYNAACVYAIAMNARDIDGSKAQLAHMAYRELEDAVRGAESGFVMLKRSWLLAEDPDLAQLREDGQAPRMARLEREVYPHSTPDRKRFEKPRPIHIEMAISNSQLLKDLADVMEQVWHRRDSQNLVDVHDAIKWFEDEKTVWENFHRVASSQARNWPDRERLLQKVHEIADPSLLVELPAKVPEFNDVLDDDEEWGKRDSASKRIEGLDDRLALLNQLIKPPDGDTSPIDCSTAWLATVKKADAAGAAWIRRSTVRKVCAGYAAVWQMLRDMVDLSELKESEPQALKEAFKGTLQKLSNPPRQT